MPHDFLTLRQKLPVSVEFFSNSLDVSEFAASVFNRTCCVHEPFIENNTLLAKKRKLTAIFRKTAVNNR